MSNESSGDPLCDIIRNMKVGGAAIIIIYMEPGDPIGKIAFAGDRDLWDNLPEMLRQIAGDLEKRRGNREISTSE